MISGKYIGSVRADLGMTQPQFARWLSQESGEVIDSKMVCRMENFRASDACHPVAPSPAVIEVLHNYPLKKKVDENPDHRQTEHQITNLFERRYASGGGKPFLNGESAVARIEASVDSSMHAQRSPKATEVQQDARGRYMNKEDQKRILQKVVDLYTELGLQRASGDTAIEMIESIEADIRSMEKELLGDTLDEPADIKKQLAEIEQQELKIDAELAQIMAELDKARLQHGEDDSRIGSRDLRRKLSG